MSNFLQTRQTGFFPWWVLERRSDLMEWLDRQRQRAHLARLDARMLEDIGVTRADADRESRLWT